MSKCGACDNPCGNSWCAFTEIAIITCGVCGAVTEKEFHKACEEGPDCCPSSRFEIEVKG